MNNTSDIKLNFPIKKWTTYNFLGWLLGTIFVLILSSSFDAIGIENLQFFVAVGIGLGIGTAQWIVLKRITEIKKNWITVTVIGLTIPFLIADTLRYFELLNLKSLFIPVCVGIGSLLVGFFQSKLLKDYNIGMLNWIIISFFSWTLIAVTVYSVEYTHLISKNVWFGFITNLVLLLSGGIILGIITGKHLERNLQGELN
ncbi:MAG: hypothetical protein GY936_19020 [Ignavibacteriae bacterium]|nr:hypothetical protein [Ignavibacteriota bacterium]